MAKPMYYWNGTAWEAVGPEVPQSPIAYQASAPSTPSTGDLWIDSDQDLDTYQRQLVRYKFIASGGETSLSGADANSAVLSYTPGAEQVYLNGALLVRGSDYVATNGTSITSLAALSVNDVVEIFAYVAFNVANTYTQSQVDGLVAPMGLVHINTQTITGTPSAININDVFSADYKNYKMIITALNSVATDIQFRLRASGSDNSSANYHRQRFSAGNTSLNGLRTTGATLGVLGECGTSQYMIITEIAAPYLAQPTVLWSENPYNGTSPVFQIHGNYHNVSSAFDGITIYPISGTFTSGTIQIFGYKD